MGAEPGIGLIGGALQGARSLVQWNLANYPFRFVAHLDRLVIAPPPQSSDRHCVA
jgi:hypothetical protein